MENSLSAFRRAVALGADGIELDIHATTDGQFAVVHDDTLDGRRIADLDLDEVRRHTLPNGEMIPSLAEALVAIGRKTTVFVEVKAIGPDQEPTLLARLDSGPAPNNYHIHSFDHGVIRRLQRRAPGRIYGILSEAYPAKPLDQLDAAGATELWQHDATVDRRLVESVHAGHGLVYVWTVDDRARMRALRDMGVDGICTNRPDVARSTLT